MDADPQTAVVLKTPDKTISEWEVGNGYTVADNNPDYDPDEPVVVVAFKKDLNDRWPDWTDTDPDDLYPEACDNGVKWYAFPESRLMKIQDSQ